MRSAIRGLGFLLQIPAVMAALSIPVAAVAGEWYGVAGFALTLVVACGCGGALIAASRGAPPVQRYQAMQVAAVAWLAIPLVGTAPFLTTGWMSPSASESAAVFARPLMALFESVSGFTSTGLSVVPRPSELPHHLHWWRSLSEWVGGIGVIVLLLTVLPPERSSLYLYFSEAREEKILPTVTSTVRAIWALFAGLTAVVVVALWLAGEPLWHALNHGMTAIATGGFSVTDDSIAGAPPTAKAVYAIAMIAGAVSFAVHYRVLRERRLRGLLRDQGALRLFLVLATGGAAVAALERWWFDGGAPADAVMQWISALTTTGLSTEAVSLWHPAPLLLLVCAMVIGPMAGSTGSGIKVTRFALMLRDLHWTLRSFGASAHEVVRVPFSGRRHRPEEFAGMARNAAMLALAWILTWVLGVAALLHVVPANTPPAHVFFEATSALSNVGLSTGLTSADMHPVAAAITIALMILGRLEVFPALILAALVIRRGGPPARTESR